LSFVFEHGEDVKEFRRAEIVLYFSNEVFLNDEEIDEVLFVKLRVLLKVLDKVV
jgi:hypothetical protein